MNNFLKQVRTSKQLTLKELADKTGISFSTIGNYETGKRGISDEYLKKIATALQVPVSEIAPPRHVIELSDGFKKDSLEVEPVMKGQSIRGLHTAPMEAFSSQTLESMFRDCYAAKDFQFSAQIAWHLYRRLTRRSTRKESAPPPSETVTEQPKA